MGAYHLCYIIKILNLGIHPNMSVSSESAEEAERGICVGDKDGFCGEAA